MKKTVLKSTLLIAMLVAGLSLTACGRNNNENEGTEDAQETNGNTYGSESALDNEGSGRAAETYDTTTATDTVSGTTTGSSATTTGSGTGTGAGTNNGGNR